MQAFAGIRSFRAKSLRIPCAIVLGMMFVAVGASASPTRATLTASPFSINFRPQAAGTTSAPVTVTLTNNGSTQVSVASVSSSTAQFSFSGPSLPFTLSSGQSIQGFVTFTPSASRFYFGQLAVTLSTGFRTSIELWGTGSAPAVAAPPTAPPAITSNPSNQTVTTGHTATFSVAATSTVALSYQWKMNGAAIGGATSASYITAATTSANSGETFSVAVSNSAGTITSSSATLTVNPITQPPAITSNPANETVIAGQTATFSVAATSTVALSYQWKMNGAAIGGATSASYTTAGTTSANSGETFSVAVSNSAGTITSSSATLTVNPITQPPAITSNPASETVIAGQTATFSVTATSTVSLSYQWKMNGTAISGATSSSYTTAATTSANSGQSFSVAVSNSAGTATSSSATLTVNPIIQPPAITSNPANQTVIAGQTATFFVVATGSGSLSYQWKLNGGNISGATSMSYTTAATTVANSGESFSVSVSNSGGAVASAGATLTVNPATASLSSNPSSLNFGTVAMSSSTVLPVTLTNSGNSNVIISNVSVSGAGFSPSGISTGQILAPGNTTMSVTFAPPESGNAAGTVTITSNATNSPVTISLSGAGAQPTQHSVTLAWSPSTSSVAGYNIYRATSTGGLTQTSPINGTTLVATNTYIDTTVTDGTTYYYAVTAVSSSDGQSADSNEVSAIVP